MSEIIRAAKPYFLSSSESYLSGDVKLNPIIMFADLSLDLFFHRSKIIFSRRKHYSERLPSVCCGPSQIHATFPEYP